MNAENGTKTYRGRDLSEVLPRIRADLGDDAVILAQREDVEGGVGGFFAKRVVEVDACAVLGRIDVQADEPALPDGPLFVPAPPAVADETRTPEEAPAAEPPRPSEAEVAARVRDFLALPALVEDAPAPTPDATTTDVAVSGQPSDSFEAHLKALLAAPAPAPAHQPAIAPQVPEIPVPEAEVEPEPTAAEPVAGSAPVLDAPGPVPAPDASAPATDPEAAALRDALVETGIGPALAGALVEETVTHLAPLAKDPALAPLVQRALAARIPTHAARGGAGGRVVGFVGPGGSGKTRCVARLATAYARRSPLAVACVSLRPEDGGAELRELLAPVGVAIHAEQDAAQAAITIAALREEAIVLLDTPGVSPRAAAELRVLAAELAQLRADEIHLAMPATIGPRAARELLEGTRELGTDAIAITHADETDALGTVVDLAIETRTPLSFVARGRSLEAGLRSADPAELAEALLA